MTLSATPEIGPVIQKQRKARHLTLEQLAALSGVSKSMLSQIERSQVNPTFAVLWSLTQALKIEFSELIAGGAVPQQAEEIEIVSRAHTPEISSADGSCKLRILSPPNLAGRSEWYEVEIAPGGRLQSAPHAAGAFEHLTAWSKGLQVSSGATVKALAWARRRATGPMSRTRSPMSVGRRRGRCSCFCTSRSERYSHRRRLTSSRHPGEGRGPVRSELVGMHCPFQTLWNTGPRRAPGVTAVGGLFGWFARRTVIPLIR